MAKQETMFYKGGIYLTTWGVIKEALPFLQSGILPRLKAENGEDMFVFFQSIPISCHDPLMKLPEGLFCTYSDGYIHFYREYTKLDEVHYNNLKDTGIPKHMNCRCVTN